MLTSSINPHKTQKMKLKLIFVGETDWKITHQFSRRHSIIAFVHRNHSSHPATRSGLWFRFSSRLMAGQTLDEHCSNTARTHTTNTLRKHTMNTLREYWARLPCYARQYADIIPRATVHKNGPHRQRPDASAPPAPRPLRHRPNALPATDHRGGRFPRAPAADAWRETPPIR